MDNGAKLGGANSGLLIRLFIYSCAGLAGASITVFVYVVFVIDNSSGQWAGAISSVLGSAVSAIIAYVIATHTVERSITPVWRQVELQTFESGIRVQQNFLAELRTAQELISATSKARAVGRAVLEHAKHPSHWAAPDPGSAPSMLLTTSDFGQAISALNGVIDQIRAVRISSIPDYSVDIYRGMFFSTVVDLRASIENVQQCYRANIWNDTNARHRHDELAKWLTQQINAEKRYREELERFATDARQILSEMAPFAR